MATFEITSPDGKKYRVSAPEGATEKDAIKHLQSQIGWQKESVTKQTVDPYTQTAQKQSTVENLLAGAGGGMYGMYLGAKQLLGKTTPEEIDQHKRAMAGLRSTTAGTVGDIGGQIAASLPASLIPGVNTYLGAGLAGAGIGALQPTQKEGERLSNAAIGATGGLIGNAVGRGIGKLLQPVPRSIDNATGVEAAKRLGMQLTPGQRTGSTGLQQAESVLSRTPGSAGMFDRIKDLNQSKINAAAAKSIGENSTNLTEKVIARASDRIGKTFNELSSKSKVSLDDDFTKLINELKGTNEKLGPFRNPQVDGLIKKSTQLAQMEDIPGDVYQVIRSELTSGADDAYRAGNSAAGRAMKDIRNALDDSAKKGLSAADQIAWDKVRKEYASLKTLVKGNTIEAGNVKPNLINSAMAKFNPQMYKSGAIDSPLNDIGVIAQNFKQSVPNSGTPERTAMQNMLFGNPVTGIPSMALANMYGRAYLSKPGQAYMNNGMVKMSPGVRRFLANAGLLSGATSLSNVNNQNNE